MKTKIEKNSIFFLTPNFIPEEKNMKWTCKSHTYEHPGRQMRSFRTQFLVSISEGMIDKLHPII